MADLIDRQAALDAVKFKTIDDGGVVDDCIMQVLALAKSKINKLPAVDAVEVVYCDKCIYSNSCKIEGMLLGDGIEKPYCAGGERREENAAD